MERTTGSLTLAGAECHEKNSEAPGNSFVDIWERLF